LLAPRSTVSVHSPKQLRRVVLRKPTTPYKSSKPPNIAFVMLIYSFRGYTCQSPLATYPWMYTDLCGSTFTSSGIYTLKSLEGNQVVETPVALRGMRDAANAYSVQVRWQASDSAVLQTVQPNGSPPNTPAGMYVVYGVRLFSPGPVYRCQKCWFVSCFYVLHTLRH